MSPDQYCQQKAAASGSSFYYSFLFLPPERRRAITALSAFCREVDDAVDEASDAQRAAVKLAWWRAELANLGAGRPQHPVAKALLPFMETFSISTDRLGEIIDGMEMDLTQTRYLDWAGLERYCYRVAGVVGILAAGIFGYRDARTLDYARRLGIAFQLTNIIRDVGEDARKNRIYLPMEDLKAHGVPASDILQGRETDAFRALMRFEAERAKLVNGHDGILDAAVQRHVIPCARRVAGAVVVKAQHMVAALGEDFLLLLRIPRVPDHPQVRTVGRQPAAQQGAGRH